MANQCTAPLCDREAVAKGYCSRCYNRWKRHGDPVIAHRMVPRGSSLSERLDLLSDKSDGPKACWPWIGTIHHTGYGIMKFENKFRNAHVWAYISVYGEPPKKKPFILHHCDNRRCVNPVHLYAGTHQDNMDDKVRRQRQARLKGESCPMSILTEKQVIEIRNKRSNRPRDLAVEYGTSKANIHRIWNRETWKHIP